MRFWVMSFVVATAICCKNSSAVVASNCDTVFVSDTVFMPELPPVFDTVYIVKSVDSSRVLKDTINARTKRLNLANYKLSKIDYYVKIVDSKPSQLTFLKGWVKRALRD
jgi:hypothetical protein